MRCGLLRELQPELFHPESLKHSRRFHDRQNRPKYAGTRRFEGSCSAKNMKESRALLQRGQITKPMESIYRRRLGSFAALTSE